MENSRIANALIVNLTGLGSRRTGAGAYASFCARTVERQFGARVVTTPAWIERVPRPVASLARLAVSWALLNRTKGIVYNPTYRAVPGLCGQIVTILDLIPLSHPTQHRLMHRYFTRVLPGILAHARGVIVLSQTMRSSVAERFDMPPERIHVVPPGVDTGWFTPGPGPGAAPYLLAAGASLPHKNLEELLRMASLWSDRRELVITGAHPAYRRVLESVARSQGVASRVRFESYVSPERIRELYRGCDALVYPSRDEGFGLPPLEAFACGRPAIVSDIAVHREVCDEAAIFARIADTESWRAAFAQLDKGECAGRVSAGAARARHFSWDYTASRLVDSIRALT